MNRKVGIIFLLIACSLSLLAMQQRPASQQVEWLYQGGDPAGTRYSQLTDINANTVSQLRIAWQWKHWETAMPEYGTIPGFFEATPLMVDGVLYVTTPYNSIAALDAETGKELWRFDGEAYKEGQVLSASGWKLRGTAFWRDGRNLRILLNSRHRLFSLDARTGEPVHTFGNNGEVSLTDLPRISDPKHATQSSPPTVYKDLVIMGSQVPDRVQQADPMGYVQAINARTGKRVWTFSVIPQSPNEPGADTWENETWRNNGHGNDWAPIALEEASGLLYVPTSTPSSDYYGGQRPGSNLFAESLVCLDAATGKLKWYFQTVHHDLWDYDLPPQPTLVDIVHDGKKIPALIQSAKTGLIFILDRRDGKPVYGVEERPVPKGDTPGEWYSPTQPFPLKPPPLARMTWKPGEISKFTPEHQKYCEELFKNAQNDGPYAPVRMT